MDGPRMSAPDRWRRVSQLYHAALACEARDRALFLAQSCAGDTALQQEVETLLAHDQGSASFLEVPAPELAAQQITQGEGGSIIGRNIGSYRVSRLLGTGGMGEVYQAKDTQLKRDVALKVLPESFAQDPERLTRFQR